MNDQNSISSPERKTILQVYSVFGVGLVLSVLPFLAAAGLSLLLVIGALIAAYVIRDGKNPESLSTNHMTWIIRTIWIGSLVGAITITVASVYLYQTVDNTPLDPCIQKFYDMAMGGMTMNVQIMSGTFSACLVSYMSVNIGKFIIAAAIGALPILIYFFTRYIRGLSRAIKGDPIAKPESWL